MFVDKINDKIIIKLQIVIAIPLRCFKVSNLLTKFALEISNSIKCLIITTIYTVCTDVTILPDCKNIADQGLNRRGDKNLLLI